MERCNEIATKKITKMRQYITEECGSKAKYRITYKLRDHLFEKNLCKRHLTSVTAWLDRINVGYISNEI